MLGPGIMLTSVPAALIAAIVAMQRAPDRPFAITALALSALEALLLACVLALSFVMD
jgi:hypothetical protein